jgi:hypothetical protein
MEDRVRTLERAREEKQAHGEIETEHPGYLGAQDTYYVGTIKSIGRIYQQTFLDTYSKLAFVKLYDRKNALVAADLLNDRVLPFLEEQNVPLLRVLTAPAMARMERMNYLERLRRNVAWRRSCQRKPMASARASIAPCKKSSIALRFAKSSIAAWTSCSLMWMFGWVSTMKNANTPASTATGEHPGRLSWIPNT